ncbi:MAG: hypothetical protein LUI87_06295 [Lachnospiraceae bacterium]|nr:hypothetical protein [Lachnospiraceae bacterium]
MSNMKICIQSGSKADEKSNPQISETSIDSAAYETSQSDSETNQPKRKTWIPIIIAVTLITAVASSGVHAKMDGGFGTAFGITASAESELEDTIEEDSVNAESEDITLSYDLVKSSSPEEFVENYCKYYLFAGEYEKFWDDCVSQATKDTGYMSRKDFVVYMEQYYSDIEYDAIEIDFTEHLEEGIIAVYYSLYSTADGENGPYGFGDYLIEENGEYKYLLYGLKSIQRYTVQTDELLIMDSLEVYTHADSDWLDLYFVPKNRSSANIYIGLVNGAAVTITMKDETVYTGQLAEALLIDSEYYDTVYCSFDGAAGEITSVMIEPVYMADDTGLPDTSSEHSVTYTVVLDE